MGACLHILLSADGPYYVGITRDSVEKQIAEHFERIEAAIAAERQVKGWRREKKEALIRGDFAALPALALAYQRR